MDIHIVGGVAVFSLLGLTLFVLGFVIIDKITPINLWKEIAEKQNIALAIMFASAILGLSNIIASAIHPG